MGQVQRDRTRGNLMVECSRAFRIGISVDDGNARRRVSGSDDFFVVSIVERVGKAVKAYEAFSA